MKENDVKKDEAKVKIEVEAPPEKVSEQAIDEKMDQMKITAEAETNKAAVDP